MKSRTPFACSRRLLPSQSGFTLVEIMVGLVIGMIATLIIMQVFSVFEAQKRTTSGTADAQTNGSIALFSINREVQQAGWAVMPTGLAATPFNCTTLFVSGVVDATIPNILTPAVITDGVSDSITVRYGTSPMGGAPTPLLTPSVPPGPGNATVLNTLGCQDNDTVLISAPNGGTTCSITTVNKVTSATQILLKNIDPATSGIGSNLACLGTWNEVSFRVNNGNLERQAFPNGPWTPTVADIVNLQAQYGISAGASSNAVTNWVDATDPLAANRNWIKAVRIAVVARNAKREPNVVTFPCSSLTGASPTGLCAWEGTAASPAPAIVLGADADHYRYRVFESILPIRNIIWSKGSLK